MVLDICPFCCLATCQCTAFFFCFNFLQKKMFILEELIFCRTVCTTFCRVHNGKAVDTVLWKEPKGFYNWNTKIFFKQDEGFAVVWARQNQDTHLPKNFLLLSLKSNSCLLKCSIKTYCFPSPTLNAWL